MAPFASSRFTKRQPAGGSSRATPKATSPAVVTAETAPKAAAICADILFAPRCPPNSGTTTAPSSETEITGGSVRLSANKGATARIRMPDAQTPTTGTPAANRSRAWSSALSKNASAFATRSLRPCTCAPRTPATRWAVASPERDSANTTGFKAKDRPLSSTKSLKNMVPSRGHRPAVRQLLVAGSHVRRKPQMQSAPDRRSRHVSWPDACRPS